uniref:ATP-grasp domain-containing protein n=1 Tax=viral metagenome TaxID=1070528 RepID=A0A6C0BSU4_9ZZZZ
MSEFVKTTAFTLAVYSNKNSSLFEQASENVVSKYEGRKDTVGIIYDDFNANMDIVKSFKKKYKNIKTYHVAPRRTTLQMDDKKFMAKRMNGSNYVPKHYERMEDIPKNINKNQLFYVKKRGSSGANGVQICRLGDIPREIINECVIQENNFKPDLFNNKRYKIRVYVVLFDKKVYINKKCWGSVATTDYKEDITGLNQDELKKMNIIHQSPGRVWINGNQLSQYDKIFKNLTNSIVDFKGIYEDEISKIGSDEFSILGFDYVVAADKSVSIIEINHRSNYSHPEKITKEVDIPVLEDVLKLLIQGNEENTEFTLVPDDFILDEKENIEEVKVQEVKQRLTNYKLIKMEGKEYYYVETKRKSGLLYETQDFKKYLENEDIDLPSEVGSLTEKSGKHVFTPKN